MIRGGSRSGRIARVVGVVMALAVAAPTAAGAQSAVEEYSLDIPGGGGGSDSGTPSSGVPSAGTTASGTPTDTSSGSGGGTGIESSAGGGGGNGADAGRAEQEKQSQGQASDELEFGAIHDGGSTGLDTSSRSAPEVVADTLLDGAMLPILAALVLITGFGAWRVLRSRGTLTRQAG
jgi:hypothetical protein